MARRDREGAAMTPVLVGDATGNLSHADNRDRRRPMASKEAGMIAACLTASALAGVVGFAAGIVFLRWRDRHERAIEKAARQIVEGMPASGWSTDRDGNFTYINTNLKQFYGANFTNEHRVLRADGVYRWIRASANPARDAAGAIVAWYGTSVDIDELKQTDLALRRRERELQLLIDTVPAQIWCCTPDGVVSYFNQRLRDYIGHLPNDFKLGAARVEDANRVLMHPDDLQTAEAGLRHSLRTGESFAMRFRIRRADGV